MSFIRNLAGQTINAGLTNATTGAAFIGTVTCYVTIDQGSQAVGQTNSGICTAKGNGQYQYYPTAAEMNGVLIDFNFIATGAVQPVNIQVATLTAAQNAALVDAITIQSQTALGIITDAMVEIGAYAPGETLSPVHANLGLLRFQNQLNSWQADELALSLQDRQLFTLIAGTTEFMVGPTGDLVTARPVYVEGMNYLNPGSTPATEVPMAPMDTNAYMVLSQKDLPSTLPQQFYFNATWPNATFFIWPQVTQNVGLVLYLDRGVDVPPTLNSAVTGPQGYAEAFMYQLALRLCTPMARPIPDGLPQMASAAYARMRRPNEEPGLLGMDAALTPVNGGAFNILTGTTTGSSNR